MATAQAILAQGLALTSLPLFPLLALLRSPGWDDRGAAVVRSFTLVGVILRALRGVAARSWSLRRRFCALWASWRAGLRRLFADSALRGRVWDAVSARAGLPRLFADSALCGRVWAAVSPSCGRAG